MLFELATSVVVLTCPTPVGVNRQTQGADSTTLGNLEQAWNRAHLAGDTLALADLWADDLVVAVPEMPLMSKGELLGFWRSGRSNITRYESSTLQIRLYGRTAVVTGLLNRERNFNGRILSDRWHFTKIYIRRGGRWQVVLYHASTAPPSSGG